MSTSTKKSNFQIIAGTFNVYHRNPRVQVREIKDVFPFLVPRQVDLAVVVLKQKFKMLDSMVHPILLAPQGFFPKGEIETAFCDPFDKLCNCGSKTASPQKLDVYIVYFSWCELYCCWLGIQPGGSKTTVTGKFENTPCQYL